MLEIEANGKKIMQINDNNETIFLDEDVEIDIKDKMLESDQDKENKVDSLEG